MQEHGLVAFTVGGLLEESGSLPLDLDTTTRLVLDVLDVGTTMTNDLSAEVETWNRL